MTAGAHNPVRIAMWSGPRNISTALMRAWDSRADTSVTDEPLYAHYLKATGADHPGREEVIAHHETDPEKVIARLTGPVPEGKPIWYQKHMAHHLLPGMDTDWIDALTNCFLIRDPREMITSFIKVVPDPSPEDLGLPQQIKLFQRVRARTGHTPPVIDSADVLQHPRAMLEALCNALGLPFDDAMLSWPPGPRKTDGVWAKHWYSAVEKSTGFAPYRPKDEQVPSHLSGAYHECLDHYRQLSEHRITPPSV